MTKRLQTGMKPASRWSNIQSFTHWRHQVFSVTDTVIVLAKESSLENKQLQQSDNLTITIMMYLRVKR